MRSTKRFRKFLGGYLTAMLMSAFFSACAGGRSATLSQRNKMMAVLGMLMLVLMLSDAHAGVIFTDRAAWEAAARGPITTEDFESAPLGLLPIGGPTNKGLVVLLGTPASGKDLISSGIGDAAYPLLAERVSANRTNFYVYLNADSGFNHGFPSGFFADKPETLRKIHLDTACVDDPNTANGCSTDSTRLDRDRGTVWRISFDPLSPGEFAGVNLEEPENWGVLRTGVGYDLRGATHLVFDVRSPTSGGIWVQFGVGGRTTGFIHIPQSLTYTPMSIPLSSFNPSPPDLADVHILFAVATNNVNAPGGGTVLLDNIRFEPVPTRQQSSLSLPLSTQTFGVIPRQTPDPGRVPIPPDQINRNVATIYEAALTLLALLARGTAPDLDHARLIADAFLYALHHDNHGDLLPVAPDGSTGLHNAYESGDLALLNDQAPPGAGRAGDVRLAGFSASPVLCGPSGFCLVLDGATGGNNAFAILALAAAYRQFNDLRYLDGARTIGRWIVGNLTDNTGTGYGGYYLGYPDEGIVPKTLLTGKSVENNADLFAAFMVLAAIERQLGHDTQAQEWTRRAQVAGDFVMEMFDPALGRFYAGTVPFGTSPGPGIDPTGPQRGGDVINVFDFLDANTFTTLALAAAPRYRNQIDWRRPVRFVLGRFAQLISAGGREFRGFNLVEHPTAGPNGIAWEFTGQAVVAMRFVDHLYQESGFEGDAALYLDQLRQAQISAPFGDGRGLAASTLQDGDLLPPIEQCLSTPFQCIPERVGLAATAWAIFADRNANPLNAFPQLALRLNQAAFRQGETLILAATVTPGLAPVTVDAYVAVRLPDGTLLFLQGDGSFTLDLRPIVAGWTVAPFEGEVFRYPFGGGEPPGNYAWLAAFTESGTLNLIGAIVQAPFSFSP